MGIDDVPLWKFIVKSAELKPKNRKTIILATLTLVTGCFFYLQNFGIPSFVYAKEKETGFIGGPLAKQLCLAKGQLSPEKIVSFENANSNLAIKCDEVGGISAEQKKLEKELYELVGDYPIREMVPYIARFDREVAGFIVGIAKKESNWGENIPTKEGFACYNYWGYKGAGTLGHAMGYGCFADPEEAVAVIGGRIQKLVDQRINTPQSMVVWKCGNSCAGHDPQSVQKWISDINVYFRKIASNG